jgi:hypothetical protein
MRAAGQAFFSALLVAAVAAAPSAGSASPSPQAVLKALLAAKVKAAQVPHGYAAPAVLRYAVSKTAKSHHAIGGAQISLDGGNEAVIYIVFATPADAKADFDHANLAGKSTSKAPSSLPKPSVVVSTSATGTVNSNTVTIGITDVAFVQGPVVVQAATTSTTSTTHGDIAGALALAKFASKHLKSVA